MTYTYGVNSRLRTTTQAPFILVRIEYDLANRRSPLTLPNGVSTEHQYDVASRLATPLYRNPGGLLGDLQDTYDARGNRQVDIRPRTITLDDNGNLGTLTHGSSRIARTWDARNRRRRVTGPSVS